MPLLYSLFLSLLFFCPGVQAAGGLYVITIDVENAPAGKFGKGFGSKVVGQNFSVFRDCIDFSRTKASGNLDRYSVTFRLLSHSNLQSAEIESLRESLCVKQDDCDVQVESEYIANDELRIGVVAPTRERGLKGDVTKYALPRALPRFSDSCETGEDRRLNAGNTDQARKYLREIGIDRANTGSLELFRGAKNVYNFGQFHP